MRGQRGTAQLRQLYRRFLQQLAIAQKLLRNFKLLLKVWSRLDKIFLSG
ncbi:hypothetical protein CWATWH8502_4438 [Crocosphaera watsonii WH 8502]|uniref:Uncharacterized protein n=3 Tax=Crocosphaera watsonii TaxID=263511 RepID=T2JK47_CROWT|nr:hypothetical protein CWATWH0003_2682 [Crocosphaera watsonii WH 0003]CCQ50980.1 hypothetical protein CWATWH8502_4438 [Crocosphaera watsonii WH 8502]CCQ65429.1 hypothetical protein CWATWH0402_2903 [Crocosphaera watsonii WH 0402]